MRKIKLSTIQIIMLFLIQPGIFSCQKQVSTIGFYNLENLFDTIASAETNDDEFLPGSDKDWNSIKYNAKLDSLAKIISIMNDGKAPQVLGMCEMENKQVIRDLISRPAIKQMNYKILHEESLDRRGIDVSLIYTDRFTALKKPEIKVVLDEEADFVTRDILHAVLKDKKKNEYHVFVNHWPSRWGGKEASDPKRMAASQAIKSRVEDVLRNDENANIIIMGDFNDEPVDLSLQNLILDNNGIDLHNAFESLDSENKGSYCYRGDWNMLDQIIISPALKNGKKPDYIEDSASIFEKDWMKQKGEDNPYKGYPLRTWGGSLYLGGYSDHFPVYIRIMH